MFFWQNLIDALVQACVYALIAVGLTMVYGILKILHIAHAAVYAAGAAAGLVVFQLTGNFWLSLLSAMAVSGALGALIYRGVYYYQLDLPRLIPLITSIGLFLLIEDLLQKPYLLGPYQHAFDAAGIFPAVKTRWFDITPAEVMVLILTAVLFVLVWLLISKTKLGLSWQAASQDREMAAAVGINLNRAVLLNFIVGSALAGAAGVLVGISQNAVYATMGDVPSYKAFVIIVLGGMGSVTGTLIASLLLALVETFLAATIGFVLPRDAIAFLLLILVLMFWPHGLMGRQ